MTLGGAATHPDPTRLRVGRLVDATRAELGTVVGITVVAAALRFATLDTQSLWFDESVTASLVERPLGSMLRALPSSETAPPLYYLVAWAWTRVFGFSDAALHSLSALAGTLTVPAAWAAARALVSRSTAILVAVLATVSPLLVWYSQEARAYGLLTLLGTLSLLCFAHAWRAPTSRVVAAWAVLSCLALATYYYAAFLVVAEMALLLLRHGRRRSLLIGSGAVVATIGVLAPLAVKQGSTGNAAWIHGIPLTTRVEEALHQLLTPAPASAWAGAGDAQDATRGLWVVGLTLLVVGLGAALHHGNRRERQGTALAFVLGTIAVVVPLLIALVAPLVLTDRTDTFLFRALLPAWVPLTTVIAAGFAVGLAGRRGRIGAGLLAAASLAVTVAVPLDDGLQRDDWRSIAAATSTRGAVVVVPAYEWRALRRYRPELEPVPPRGTRADEIEVLIRGPGGRRFLPPAGFVLVEQRRIQYWLYRRYRSSEPVDVPVPEPARPGQEGAVDFAVLQRG